MKKIMFLWAVVALCSCQLVDVEVGNGNSVETVINVGEFDSISSGCSLSIVYAQTEGQPGVTLTCDENLAEYYRIVVEDGTLIVDTKYFVMVKPRVKSYLTVHSPYIEDISISSSGSCHITTPLTSTDELDLRVSGSGNIHADGDIECLEFSSSVSGSGHINIAGVHADEAWFRGSGSGSTHVDLLTADSITARVSGSGSINLVCKDAGNIEASTSGSGSVHLSGNARSLNSSSSGSGRVDYKNLKLGQ